jgi:hypothetical protein
MFEPRYISWIPTVSKSFALVYYITNYATKDDVSPEQLLSKATLLKQFIEKAITEFEANHAKAIRHQKEYRITI